MGLGTVEPVPGSRLSAVSILSKGGAWAEKLGARLREWKPEMAAQVRERVAEVIDLADHDFVDLVRSRATEQEVLNLVRGQNWP